MKKLQLISLITAMLAIVATSCSQSDSFSDDGAEISAQVEVRLSRSGVEPQLDGRRTFRVLFFNVNSSNLSFYGTYVSPEPDPVTGLRDGLLLPWTLDHDDADLYYPSLGNIDGDYDIMRGLYNGPNSPFIMVIVSPARMPVNQYWIGTEHDNYWGYRVNRCAKPHPEQVAANDYTTGNDGTEPLYMSDPLKIQFNSSLADIQNGKGYLILDYADRYDKMLIERRSALRIIVDTDPLLGSARISKVTLTNFTENAFLYCGTNDYIDEHKNSDELVMYQAPAGLPTVVSPSECIYAPSATLMERTNDKGDFYTFLLSKDYAAKDDFGVYTEDGPIALIYLVDDDGNESVVEVKLQYNFEPHHEYTVRITLASRYMVVRATASPWETGGDADTNHEFTVGTPMTLPIGGWEPNVVPGTEI